MTRDMGASGTHANGNCLDGVYCTVENCYYNQNRKICTAKEIKVGPETQYCATSKDTNCATFKPE